MECIYDFASSIARDLVCGAVDQLRYPCCFDNYVGDYQKEHDKFVETRNSVQECVEEARKQTKRISGVVDKWVKDANTDIDHGKKLLEEARKNKTCCFGHCPNWIWRYRLGKKIAKKKTTIESCIKEASDYAQVNRLVSLPGLASYPSEKCLKFESRQSAYEELMEALKCDDVSMIGLYGMGGCGKTTLAMEVGKRAEAEHFFDQVLFVPVSSTVEVRRIQDKIASALQFDNPEKEERERAQRLCQRFAEEERILVILDDVWEKLDFVAIGIPSSEDHKGCKVLITSRSEVVCTLMDCQRKIHLLILTNEEAWALFQKHAHISEGADNNLKHLARQISDECDGLPVAIVALACTLKGKSEEELKVALQRLKSSKPVNIENGLPNPYTCLQLSYDNLNRKEAKSLFFLCSVFPEDFEIPVEYLLRFAVGLGIVEEVCRYEGAWNEVSAAKNVLLSSCLLSSAGDGQCVKMHDLVRNVALWIAKKENKMIRCALKKDERHVTPEYNSLTYLWCEEFPNGLDCSNLEFLCINTELDVSNEIFKGMEKLRVLLLINKYPWHRRQLPVSFKSSTNLRCLLLAGWELVDISFVGDLKKLESLGLHDCSFPGLIDVVVEQLTNLRSLEFLRCHVKRYPLEVIGRHPHLEELNIVGSALWSHETAIEFFKKFSVPQALQRYHIHLEDRLCELVLYPRLMYDMSKIPEGAFLNHQRILHIPSFDTSNAAVKDLARRAEVVCMSNILGGAKNIIPDIFQIEGGDMNELIHLMIRHSDDIVCLVDTNYRLSEVESLFSKLLTLRIFFMNHLGALCCGLPTIGLFGKLEELHVSDCPKLTPLFTLALAKNLSQLKILDISKCQGLKHILADDDREEISTKDHGLLFPNLKWLLVDQCEELEYIIPINFAQGLVQLKCLDISGNSKLKYVFGRCKHGELLVDQSLNELKIELPALEELQLCDMPNIISVFPETCYAMWSSLRRFDLRLCPKFAMMSMNSYMAGSKVRKQCNHNNTKPSKEGIFQLAGLSIDAEQDPLTIYLQNLSLEGLPQLRHICNSPIQDMNFQNLEKMKVSDCGELRCIVSACIAGGLPQLKELDVSECRELKCVVSASYAGGLPQLKELRIAYCNQLDQIIEDEKHQNFLNLHLESNQLKNFPASTSIPSAPLLNHNSGSFNLSSLTRLTLKSCPLLGSLFRPSTAKTLTSLEELRIEDCHGLKHIITSERVLKEEIAQDDHDFQSYTPVFQSLKELRVMKCNLLQYIFPVSFARGLLKLKCIVIEETPELTYLFGLSNFEDRSSHQLEKKIQIELPILETLDLERIPNLISICPDNYYVTLSSMPKLRLHCFELAAINFSTVASETLWNHVSMKEVEALVMASNQGINETALLQAFRNVKEIFVLESKFEGILQRPSELATNGKLDLLQSFLRKLVLCCLPELMYICKGPVHSISLEYLEMVKLESCDNLKCLFSSCIARGLPQLKELEILFCDKLEQIFEDEGNQEFLDLPMESCQVENCPNDTSNASVTLQIAGPFNVCNLKRLVIRYCPMLRSLFTPSTAISLTSLEELRIEECHRLRYLLTYKKSHKNKEEIIPEDHDFQSHVSMFPSLRTIHVDKCNLLEYVFHVYFAQGLVKLKAITIKHTPHLRYLFGQSIQDVHSAHPYLNKIQIELPVLEYVYFYDIPNMISTFPVPDYYYVTCPSLRRVNVENVGLSTLNLFTNNLMVDSGAMHSGHSSTVDPRATNVTNGQMLGTAAKIKGNNHVEELPINRQVTSSLKYLVLIDLPQLTNIWMGAKHFVSFQHLNEINICGCPKLRFIFSTFVLRSLPLLEILVVKKCEKLEQIIEDDEENENVYNLQLPKICFPQLKLLLVTHCNNLKRLFYLSTSHEFPKLEYMILSQDSHLKEVFEGKEGVKDGRLEVLLPKLEHVILMQLLNLNNIYQQIDFQTVTNLFVHNCPKLSLTSTTTAEQMLQKYDSGDDIEYYVCRKLQDSKREETIKKCTMFTCPLLMSLKDEASYESELPSSQVHGSNQSMLQNLAESVHEHYQTKSIAFTLESEKKGPQDLQSLEHQPSSIPSLNLTEGIEEDKSVQQGSTSKEVKPTLSVVAEGISLGCSVVANQESSGRNMLAQNSQLVEQGDNLSFGEKITFPCQKIQNSDGCVQMGPNMTDKEDEIGVFSNESIVTPPGTGDIVSEETAKKDSMLTPQLQMSLEDEASSKTELSSSQVHGSNNSRLRNLGGSVHDHELNQTETVAIISENENKGTQDLKLLEHQLSTIRSPHLTEGIEEDRGKESAQEGPISEESMRSTLSAGVEGVSLVDDGKVPAQDSQVVEQGDKQNLDETRTLQCQKIQNGNDSIVSKDDKRGVVSNDSIEDPPGASADTSRSHSLILVKLEEFKRFVKLDDAQITLLVEAITVYPHIWSISEKFGLRFQAWMFKTLGDILFFLRNESAVSVTPEREKEFHRLCDEAVQLGFERSWIDEMRQRVMVRDPGVHNAQAQIIELLKRHDQLTQELGKLKDEIDSLNDFVDAQKKCFDFL